MRTGWLSIAIVLGAVLIASRAEAQLGQRLQRRLGRSQQPQQSPNNPAPASPAPAAPRAPGQFRQGLGQLLQGALDSGAVEALAGDAQAGSLTPAAAAADLGLPSTLKASLHSAEPPFTAAWYAAHQHAWPLPAGSGDLWSGASIEQASQWLGLEAGNAPAQPAATERYLPLGVFALAPAGAHDPSALIQLAIRPDGTLRGNYCDVVTGTSWPIEGSLQKHTQLATFRTAAPGSAEIEASLVSLTRTHGSVRLRLAGGELRDWNLARFEPK